MDTEQLEHRMEQVERAVARLEKHAGLQSESHGIQAVVGSMADYPEFDDVMEYVRKRREAELAAEDPE